MRLTKIIVPVTTVAALMTMAGPVWAADPHSPSNPSGPPNQSCQDYSATTRPGNSYQSPGSPFNEPGVNSQNGGTGGANYSEKSQYDVACYQAAQHS